MTNVEAKMMKAMLAVQCECAMCKCECCARVGGREHVGTVGRRRPRRWRSWLEKRLGRLTPRRWRVSKIKISLELGELKEDAQREYVPVGGGEPEVNLVQAGCWAKLGADCWQMELEAGCWKKELGAGCWTKEDFW